MDTKVAYASTPTLTIDGTPAPGAMASLLSLTVDEDVLGMTSMEARFVNVGVGVDDPYLYLDRDLLDFGREVTVGMGPRGSETTLFTGRISALQADYPEAVPTVTICAEDKLQDFRLTRRTRSFEDSSTADIARRMASDHGLTTSVDLDGPSRRISNQLNLSDLAFLRSLAHDDGAEVWLEGDTLHLQRRQDRDGAVVSLRYAGELHQMSLRADLAHQCTDLTVAGWSVADKEAIAETAGGSLVSGELGPDQTAGSDLLGEAFTERHERLVVSGPIDSTDARARAEAAYLARARRFVTGSGTAGGSPGVRVGVRVALDGLGKPFNGEYRVTRTRHRFDLVNGYCTDFDVERPGIGAP